MKKILILNSGGRKNGNTTQLVNHFMQGASEEGHQVESIFLGDYQIQGCIGCYACHFGKPCVLKDDFQMIAEKIKASDCLVFASPLYYFTISARMKAVIERLYSLAEKDDHPIMGRYEKYPNKDCVLLMTAADGNFWTFENALSYYRLTLVNYLGFNDLGNLLAYGCGGADEPPKINQSNFLMKAYQFGKNLYKK